MTDTPLYARFILSRLHDALSDTPVVLIQGPRQCGKTTLALMAGEEYEYITFDDTSILAAADRDPVGFITKLSDRVILDEVQRAPELFVSIKRSVDKKRAPGRFILTGSSNVLLLPKLSDSLAGRMEIIQLHPFSQDEVKGKRSAFLQRAFKSDFSGARGDRLGGELVERVTTGGFPEPISRRTDQRRKRWYHDYVKTLIERDIRDLSHISKAETIPRLLLMLANHSAQLLNVNEVSKAFQLTRPTIDHYIGLLRKLFLVEFLPPWSNNRNSRLIKTPKLHLADSGLACALLNVSKSSLDDEHHLFGHLLETFVYTELRKQASWYEKDLSFFYYRDKDQYEVDIVIEDHSRGIVGVEVKATATVRDRDFKGLRRLQRQVGKKMRCGILLYDGERVLSFGDGMLAVPVNVLWQP